MLMMINSNDKFEYVEMLEDLIVTAHTEAFKQVEATSAQMMSGATAGMPMPPGFKLPF